jgi:hypothetical protein
LWRGRRYGQQHAIWAHKSGNEQYAIAALVADHERVKALFKRFKKVKDEDEEGKQAEKGELVEQICRELKVHAQIEEEIFYPAVRAQIDQPDLMDEALVEHAGAKELTNCTAWNDGLGRWPIRRQGDGVRWAHRSSRRGRRRWDVSKAKRTGMDTAQLAAQMEQRRAELKAEMGIVGSDDEEEEEWGERGWGVGSLEKKTSVTVRRPVSVGRAASAARQWTERKDVQSAAAAEKAKNER